ncbi:HlyC/CorC family transporter [Nocardia puris]|uniref:hemolysin family protein n=1 Tax=Nocardia puris TaxID=208602 RepID=UPI001894D555|nr:hemolysin family protein [Nocardia puris]MBF6209628.1 HlyC/CorC family transporter [Nocardia puris]MBF6366200.1 HlyC/CorC family transporter [Nocardia puris]MBF6458461.1 HlyC/CorC family transporter [Nocardia puris]
MSADTLLDFGLVLLFVLLGGVFAATEIALVTLRESQIRRLSRRGRRGARTAALARDPNRFLSAVQIGVTVAGFFSAAYGASALAPDLAPTLRAWGLPGGSADAVAVIMTTLLVSYLSLVLGELVPKRLALQRASATSLVTAPALDRFATLMRPVIWLLSVSTDALVRVLGGDPSVKNEDITHEELRDLVLGHSAVPEDERLMHSELFDAGDRRLTQVMRPRTEVDFLHAHTPITAARATALATAHSRYPVIGVNADDLLGFVHLRDLLAADDDATVASVCRPIAAMPGAKPVLAALTALRRENAQIAAVIDEYGGTAGIVTVEDIVEEIVGEIGDEFEPAEPIPPPVPGPDGPPPHQQVDGLLLLDDFTHLTGIALAEGPYETVAGYVLHHLRRLPRLGDSITVDGNRLTVSEFDGNRIARLRLTRRR